MLVLMLVMLNLMPLYKGSKKCHGWTSRNCTNSNTINSCTVSDCCTSYYMTVSVVLALVVEDGHRHYVYNPVVRRQARFA